MNVMQIWKTQLQSLYLFHFIKEDKHILSYFTQDINLCK